MTDEEMAEDYANENWEHYEEGQNDSKALKQAFLAGLKASRPQWHILAEDPTLPKEGQRVRVLTEDGVIEESTLFYDTYFEELTWSNIGLLKVFAWKEIEFPKEE